MDCGARRPDLRTRVRESDSANAVYVLHATAPVRDGRRDSEHGGGPLRAGHAVPGGEDPVKVMVLEVRIELPEYEDLAAALTQICEVKGVVTAKTIEEGTCLPVTESDYKEG